MLYTKVGVNSCGRIAFVDAEGFGGYMDEKGQILVKPAYDYVGDFCSDGYAVVKKDGLYGIIDRDGKAVAKPKFSAIAQ